MNSNKKQAVIEDHVLLMASRCVWYADPKEGFLLGQIVDLGVDKITVEPENGGNRWAGAYHFDILRCGNDKFMCVSGQVTICVRDLRCKWPTRMFIRRRIIRHRTMMTIVLSCISMRLLSFIIFASVMNVNKFM